MSRKARSDMAERRRGQVSELYLAGANQRDMAASLGVSLGTINADVKILRKRWVAEQDIDTEMQRDLGRLDAAIQAIWLRVTKGDLHAIDVLLKIIEKRSKMFDYTGITKLKQDRPDLNIAISHSPDQSFVDSLKDLDPEQLKVVAHNMMSSLGLT